MLKSKIKRYCPKYTPEIALILSWPSILLTIWYNQPGLFTLAGTIFVLALDAHLANERGE